MSGKTRTPEEQARRERFGHCGKYDYSQLLQRENIYRKHFLFSKNIVEYEERRRCK